MNKKLFILPLLALCGQTMAQTDVTVNLKQDKFKQYLAKQNTAL